MASAHSPSFPSLHLRHSSFSNPSITLSTSQLILQPFRRFIYVTAQSPTFPSLYLRHSSFSNLSIALPLSQLISQPFRRFTYVTAHSPTPPSLNYVAALLILQPFRSFTYVTAHSSTIPLLYLRHSSFSNPSVALPTSQLCSFSKLSVTSHTSQLIPQPYRCFTYVTVHSTTLLSFLQRHLLFT